MIDAGTILDAGVVVTEAVKTVVSEAPKQEASSFLSSLLSPGFFALVFGVLASILTGLKVLNDQRKKYVAQATFHAYNIVNDIAKANKKSGASAVLDKVAEGLKQANEYMKANGWRELNESEVAVAKLGFQSLHGSEASRP